MVSTQKIGITTFAVVDPGFFRGGVPTPKSAIFKFFAKNCLKMKEFGPPGGRVPGAPLGSANALYSV